MRGHSNELVFNAVKSKAERSFPRISKVCGMNNRGKSGILNYVQTVNKWKMYS